MRHSNGCLSCKLRKKKCDERKPICVACERNHLICSWKAAKGHPSTLTASPVRKSSSPTIEAAKWIRGQQNSSMRGCSPSTTASATEYSPSELQETGLVPSVSVSMPSFWSTLPPDSRFLLEHYIHKTGVLSTAHIRNFAPFVGTLLPVAVSNEVLLQSMLAFSGSHLSQYSTSYNGKAQYKHLAQSLQGLKLGLTQYATGDRSVGLQLFLSIVILCITELVTAGEDRSIVRHIAALRSIARTAFHKPPAQSDCDAIGLGAECYAYLLVLSCISFPTMLDENLIRDSNFIFDFLSDLSYQSKGALFGCAEELYRQVPRATLASIQVKIADFDSPSDPGKQLDQIATMYQEVSSWTPKSDDATFKTAGKIFQRALLTLLSAASQELQAFGDDRDLAFANIEVLPVKDLISQAIVLLDEMPVRSAIATTLCWPLAVLGSYATLRSHRVTIQSFLVDMETVFSFRNMGQTRSLLESIWNKHSTVPTSTLTLSEAMAENGWESVLG